MIITVPLDDLEVGEGIIQTCYFCHSADRIGVPVGDGEGYWDSSKKPGGGLCGSGGGGGRRSGEGHLKISDIPPASSLNRTLPLQDRLGLNKHGGDVAEGEGLGRPPPLAQ